ncbi:GMC oxidoreductase-domain-containing protein [Mycena vulgaris]|nr:GMC oxidoreductase-domain-containing protein [Mycena vulgaris]
MTSPHSIQSEYDLVFAGGGTAACITASRLATAFPDLYILVLESGPTTKDKKEHIQPGQFLTHLAPTSKNMQFYTSKPSESVAGRSIVVPSGRCVGGGSSVNVMLYNRPAASDFDDWETEFGNAGWSAKEMSPMLQKAETYEIEPTKPTHGADGPLKVSFGEEVLDIGMQFLKLGPKFEQDRPWSDEGNGLDLASINISNDGCRSDVAHHYVYMKDLKNLSVLDGCLVNRVVIKDGVATGVEYLFDKRIYPSAPQDIRTVKARRLVVVSAGAMGSPLILERSGVGRKEVLERAGIPVIAELSGVGENYQDHTFLVSPYVADPATTTFDSLHRGEPETVGPLLEQWEKDGTGLLGANGVDSAIKMRPRDGELAELGPEFTGYLHITSADPYGAPDFQSGFLSDLGDVAALRWDYKKGELIRRLPAFCGALPPAHPQFPKDSLAALTETGPIPIDSPRLVYSAEDDKAIDANIRQFVETSWHSLGTCAMEPLEQGGVVDSKLNVYGIKILKVADLSIPPSNVNSNTNSTAVAIGEKAAVIIAEYLGGSI